MVGEFFTKCLNWIRNVCVFLKWLPGQSIDWIFQTTTTTPGRIRWNKNTRGCICSILHPGTISRYIYIQNMWIQTLKTYTHMYLFIHTNTVYSSILLNISSTIHHTSMSMEWPGGVYIHVQTSMEYIHHHQQYNMNNNNKPRLQMLPLVAQAKACVTKSSFGNLVVKLLALERRDCERLFLVRSRSCLVPNG